jgi:hypothetical protein
MLHSGSTPFLGQKLIWKMWAPLKIKNFLWLAFKRRHWNGDRRRRHGLDARDRYLCDQEEEVWFHVLQALGRQLPQPSLTVLRWWRSLRSMFNSERRFGIDSLFALVSWVIWKGAQWAMLPRRNGKRQQSAAHYQG